MKTLLISLFILGFSSAAFSQDSAPLDPPYQNLQHPKVSSEFIQANIFSFNTKKKEKVAIEFVLKNQSPVKSQVERGTCSIFSATALLEAELIRTGKFQAIDLSEEWLQYLISQTSAGSGSYSAKNFNALITYGQPYENTMPYDGKNWTSINDYGAYERCAHLTDNFNLGSCLTSHRDLALLKQGDEWLLDYNSSYYDPEFYLARSEAKANKPKFFGPKAKSSGLWTTAGIKETLDSGIPVTMDITFYYGSWNHRTSEELGISRDMNLWSQGVVSFPESGSMDRKNSSKKSAGHSVVIVGYDDLREVTYTKNMEDGSVKSFTRKGVYYFKNSWGNSGFGDQLTINNQIYPGYGMITQDYANQYGSFYMLSVD